MPKENGWVTKWLVGALWGILTIILVGTINNVIANDKLSRDRDTKIEERADKDKEDIYQEFKEFRKEQRVMGNTIVEMHTILKQRFSQ